MSEYTAGQAISPNRKEISDLGRLFGVNLSKEQAI